MKRIFLLFLFLFSAVAALVAFQVTTPNATGVIEGRVMRLDSGEGISAAQITLTGPTPVLSAAELAAIFTPSLSLTPEMRQQLDDLIVSAGPGASPESLARRSAQLQAQLLGLPSPVVPAAPRTAPRPSTPVGALTDGSGRFSFKNLAPGRYVVVALRDGYFGSTGSGTLTTTSSTVTVVDGQSTPSLLLTMQRGASISGRVRDSNGQPAAGMQIVAYGLNYQYARQALQLVISKMTDDRGEYRLFWLPPGEYLIAAVPRRPVTFSSAPDIVSRTFYPGTVLGRDAQTVTVVAGVEVAAVDFALRAESTMISGRVMNADGRPAVVSTFYLLPADSKSVIDGGPQPATNSALNQANGYFEIRGVVPGIYNLFAGENEATGLTAWGRTQIIVGSGGLQDVTVKIRRGIDVKARLTVDGAPPSFTMGDPSPRGNMNGDLSVNGLQRISPAPPPPSAPVPMLAIRLSLRSKDPYVPSPVSGVASTTFDPSTGISVFPNVPEGRYTLLAAVPLPLNAYLADVLIGGVSVYDTGIDVGQTAEIIDVKVKSNGARLQGSVLDAMKQPFASAIVVLVPQQARRQNPNLYRSFSSDAAGNFIFTAVPPGEYKLFAFESVFRDVWMDPEFIAKVEEKGQSVTLGSTAPPKVELKLIPK